ncbi:MAG TPA: hypothetical protein VIF82_15035 [Burkholderiaceae bacterium]|jgi:hypothetical protein
MLNLIEITRHHHVQIALRQLHNEYLYRSLMLLMMMDDAAIMAMLFADPSRNAKKHSVSLSVWATV